MRNENKAPFTCTESGEPAKCASCGKVLVEHLGLQGTCLRYLNAIDNLVKINVIASHAITSRKWMAALKDIYETTCSISKDGDLPNGSA